MAPSRYGQLTLANRKDDGQLDGLTGSKDAIATTLRDARFPSLVGFLPGLISDILRIAWPRQTSSAEPSAAKS